MRYGTVISLVILLLWSAAAVAGDAVLFRIPKDDPNENSDVISSVAWSPDGKTIAASYGRFIGLLQNPGRGRPFFGMRRATDVLRSAGTSMEQAP